MKGGVVIGEAIEVTVHEDACDNGGGEFTPKKLRGAFLEVAQEIAESGVIGRTSEGKMGEKIHI